MANAQTEPLTKPVEIHQTVSEPLRMEDLRREGITISVEKAAQYLGISRAYCYEMARDGRLQVIRVGRRRVRVITAGLLRMLGGED